MNVKVALRRPRWRRFYIQRSLRELRHPGTYDTLASIRCVRHWALQVGFGRRGLARRGRIRGDEDVAQQRKREHEERTPHLNPAEPLDRTNIIGNIIPPAEEPMHSNQRWFPPLKRETGFVRRGPWRLRAGRSSDALARSDAHAEPLREVKLVVLAAIRYGDHEQTARAPLYLCLFMRVG